MFKIMLKILEVFTIEYIPRLPIGLRKHFYKLILPLRKVKDKVALNGPKGDFTFEIRLEYAKLSRHCLLYTSPSPRDATLSRMPSSA